MLAKQGGILYHIYDGLWYEADTLTMKSNWCGAFYNKYQHKINTFLIDDKSRQLERVLVMC